MSLLTWFIMITKFFDQRRPEASGNRAEKEFWDAPNLTDAIGRLKGGSNPFRALAETGKQAFEYHEINKGRLSGAIGTSEWITESLQRTADTVASSMQSAYRCSHPSGHGALRRIARYGHRHLPRVDRHRRGRQASIDKVAGPVGEALIMTAIGLAVAVPAVLGYNILLRRNKGVQERVSHFTHELHAYLISGRRWVWAWIRGLHRSASPRLRRSLRSDVHGDNYQCDEGEAMSDINVTPLVDVMLVLLIIFIITIRVIIQQVQLTCRRRPICRRRPSRKTSRLPLTNRANFIGT